MAAAMYYRKPLPGLGPGREDLELAERLLAELGLGKLAHRSLSAVSSGEAQRAMVAHALAKKTPLVALDEPTSFQDPHGKMLVYAMLAREAEKRAVVVATHDLLFAALNAASIAMLKNGEVIAAGPPERVLNASNLEELYGAKVAEATVTIGGRRLALPLPLEAL
ncbi:MAG: hypothetical protein DSY37_01790 [Hyperthermus sp.]|nr:MAG: hypothetical protein DSY37_01790 [Hyperthermus sp.]